MKFHFITPLWGHAYLEMFTKVSLPSQLTPGNLGAFAANDDVTYEIATRAQDVHTIESSPAFRALQGMVRTQFCLIDHFDWSVHPYFLLSDGYNEVMRRERDSMTDTAFFFLASDIVWSDGSFQRTRQILEQGKRAVMVDAGFHVNAETFVPAFLRAFRDPQSEAMVCLPRPLMKLGFDHIHDITKSMLWGNGEVKYITPAHIYWAPRDGMLLGHSLILHPLAVRPRTEAFSTDAQGENTSPIDHEYTKLACKDFNDVYIVKDSDEMLAVEISVADHTREEIVRGAYSVAHVASWLGTGWANDFHIKYEREPIWFHSDDIPEEVKESAERESNHVIETIERHVPAYRLWYALKRQMVRAIPPALRPFVKREVRRLRKLWRGVRA